MSEIIEEVILNNNKQARMLIEMAEANCRCTNDVNEVKEASERVIVNPEYVQSLEKTALEQTFLLLNAMEIYHARTASFSGTVTRVKNIKNSDELENLANGKVDHMKFALAACAKKDEADDCEPEA